MKKTSPKNNHAVREISPQYNTSVQPDYFSLLRRNELTSVVCDRLSNCNFTVIRCVTTTYRELENDGLHQYCTGLNFIEVRYSLHKRSETILY